MIYTKYHTQTGEIISNFITSGDVEKRLQDGESCIEGCYDPALFQIVDGMPVEIPEASTTAFGDLVDDLRAYRDDLLKQSDWSQLPDSPLSATEQEAYRNYRQALRDVPSLYGSLEQAVWPRIEDYL